MFFFDQNKKHLEIFACVLCCPNVIFGVAMWRNSLFRTFRNQETLFVDRLVAFDRMYRHLRAFPPLYWRCLFFFVPPVCCKPNLKHFCTLISYNFRISVSFLTLRWTPWNSKLQTEEVPNRVAHHYARIHPQSWWCAWVWTRERKVGQLSDG